MDWSVQFREGTAAATALAEGPAERPRLDRLPDRRYLVAVAADLRTLPLEQWVEDLREVFQGDDEFSVSMRQMLSESTLYSAHSQALFEPQLGFNGSLFNGVSVAFTDEPEAALQAFMKDVEGLNNLEIGNEMTYRTSFSEDAMQIGGRDVDQYSIMMDVPQELLQEMGPAAMFVTQDMGGYVTTTEDALVASQGKDPALLRETLELEGDTLDENPGVTRIRAHLLEQPTVEGYLNMATLLEMANEFVMMFNPDARLDVPAGLSPIGFSSTVREGGTGGRLFVPMDVIDTVRRNLEGFTGGQGLPLGDASGEAVRVVPVKAEPRR